MRWPGRSEAIARPYNCRERPTAKSQMSNITAHPTNTGCGSRPAKDPNCGLFPGNDFLWSLAVNAYLLPAPPSAGALAAAQRRLDPSSATAFESLNALLCFAPLGLIEGRPGNAFHASCNAGFGAATLAGSRLHDAAEVARMRSAFAPVRQREVVE